MRNPRIVLLGAALATLLLCHGGRPAVAEDEGSALNFVEKALEWVEVGDPIVTDKIILFPLVVPRPIGDIGVDPLGTGDSVEFAEPDFPAHRYDVVVENGRERPVLVVGGTVLEGGKRDRLVRQSAIVAGTKDTEIATLPAASTSDIRKEAIPFKVSDILAPGYLRQKAEYGGSANTVMTFIARWLDFREDGDDRKSLIAIATAGRLKAFCLPCHEAAARFPRTEGQKTRVVGGVGVVRGRVQGLFLYGNNELVRASFPAMLRGETFPAAAIELQAEKAGVPLPGVEDPEAMLKQVTQDVNDLVASLRKATYRSDDVREGQLGEALLLRTPDGTRGRALGLDGMLVELVVFPHDPFQNALYGTALDVPDEDEMSDEERAGATNLGLRAAQGRRLTEAEKRLLERLRRGNPAGGDLKPGGVTPGVGPRRR